jgi:outer membrane protein OmpA-like peptidoglycan-associated protein
MSSIWRRLLISMFAAFALAHPAAAADCDALIANFKSAIADKAFDKLKQAMEAIADDSVCNFDIDAYRSQEMNSIIDMAAAAPTDEARNQMIDFVQETMGIGGDFRSAEELGDYYARRGEYGEALAAYDQGIIFLQNRTSPPATPEDRKELLARDAAAKNRASDDQEGRKPSRFIASARDLSGRLAGIYSPALLRGFEVVAVPLPINFYFDQARFTPAGEKAVAELAEALKQQNVESLTLVGHTDPRGDHQYNVELSKRRAAAARDYLLSHGVKASILVDGKGPDDPFDVSLLGRPVSQEEAWALDRRVEWIRKGAPE